jgi:hypothetical protein
MSKPDCYKCKHRRDLPGDCHSACHHPAFAAVMADPMARVLGIFASVRRVAPVQGEADGIKVVGHPHGIRSGWFNHPMNFDPVWLAECSGFESCDAALDEGGK